MNPLLVARYKLDILELPVFQLFCHLWYEVVLAVGQLLPFVVVCIAGETRLVVASVGVVKRMNSDAIHSPSRLLAGYTARMNGI